MHISLWQLFSSNHSSRFTVVGEFKTIEAATNAAEELSALAQAIIDWHTNEPEGDEFVLNPADAAEPSPPEIDFMQKHHFDWGPYALDWWEASVVPITQFEKLVFVNGEESDSGARPFDELIEHFGGTPKIDGVIAGSNPSVSAFGSEQRFKVMATVTCRMPSLEMAEQIRAEIAGYLKNVDSSHTTDSPWHIHNPGGGHATSTTRGHIERNGKYLLFSDLWFFHLGYGLPGLLAYLKHKGCQELEVGLLELRIN